MVTRSSTVMHVYPPKLAPGEKVAILSPSLALPQVFPAVYEQGLRRLREQFHLVPVEYPTTRRMHASPQDRARDIQDAFEDPEIKALFATIGGDDQLKVLKYLDPARIRAHPKAFFGYSDKTNLHNFLWNLGMVSYHGATIMVELGRGGAMHPLTQQALQRALFVSGEWEIQPAPAFTDQPQPWDDPASLSQHPELFPGEGWV